MSPSIETTTTRAMESKESDQIPGAKEADNHQEIRCICDLCHCGRHDCQSVFVVALSQKKAEDLFDRSEEQKSKDNNNNNTTQADHNRCQSAAELRRTDMDNMDTVDGCGCQPNAGPERYITNCKPRSSRRSRSELSGRAEHELPMDELVNGQLDEDMIHVLVTRPEIASKPRDNIIFEGDMDLKTTFETSYEALARMRLECWRRHQEQLQRQNQQTTRPGESAPPPTPSNQTEGIVSSTPEEAAVVAKCCKGNDVAIQADLLSSTSTDNNRETKRSIPRAIDPDLSPILCYDANLNRLQRVNVRKRSKYRPSTHLKSGLGGFFGEPEANNSERRHFAAETSMQTDGLGDQDIGRRSAGLESVELQHDDGQSQRQTDEQQLDEQALGRMEEEEAVKELQRATSGSGQHPDERPNSLVGTISRSERQQQVGVDGSQLAMRRICQNQSFNINDNEYSKLSSGARFGKTLVDGPTTSHQQQQQVNGMRSPAAQLGARNYKNLFNESPDFFLANNNNYNKDGHVEPMDQDVSLANHHLVDLKQANWQTQITKTDPPLDNRYCEVQQLEKGYEFVGSRSGHKYFVEKR